MKALEGCAVLCFWLAILIGVGMWLYHSGNMPSSEKVGEGLLYLWSEMVAHPVAALICLLILFALVVGLIRNIIHWNDHL